MEISELKGFRTLLHFTNLTPNAQISSSYIAVDGAFLQAIKPSHGCGPKDGRKNLTNQCLILRVDGHALIIMTNMLHGVKLSSIVRKQWFEKPLCKSEFSISIENGEQDIWCNARLIVSFPMFCGGREFPALSHYHSLRGRPPPTPFLSWRRLQPSVPSGWYDRSFLVFLWWGIPPISLSLKTSHTTLSSSRVIPYRASNLAIMMLLSPHGLSL